VQTNKPDYYNDLDKVYIKIWNLLKNGLAKRDSPFHIPTFICGKNNNFDGRIVVLRGIDEKNRKIWFHSDIRSEKIRILKSNPLSSLIFYDKNEKIQLRISCNSKINYQNDFSKNSWGKTAHMSRQCYLGENGPGTISELPTSGLSKDIDNLKYTIEESEIGYKNFCVIENFINSIEWLYLAAKGHRRALFSLNKDLIEKKWINP
tara:strand:+ start:183 stop:797 length:615 start_codon:yes stop_codon:yes gene_type:complete